MTKLWPALLLLGACTVGQGDIDDGDSIVGPSDPENPNAIRCTSAFKTSGAFNQTANRPNVTEADDPRFGLPVQGCWPVGTWSFTVTHDAEAEVLDIDGDGIGDRCGEVAGTTVPALEASYSFSVTRTQDPDSDGLLEQYTYNGSSPNFFSVKVSEGGGGDCQGGMEFASADKTQWWSFNPTICTSDETRPGVPDAQLVCKPWGNRMVLGGGEFTQYLSPREY
jgi:hypothetical protein